MATSGTCIPLNCRPTKNYICNFQDLADLLEANIDFELVQYCMKMTSAGTGFSIGDVLSRNLFYDVTTNPATLVSIGYYNETTNAAVDSVAAAAGTYDDCSIDKESKCVCMIDAAGVKFQRLFWLDAIGETVIGYNDIDFEGDPYSIAEGDVEPCSATAVLTSTAAYIAPTGVNTYSLPANINSISVTALVVATGITVDTGAGGVPLLVGQTITFTAPEGEFLDDTTFDVTTGAGDTVAINTIALT